MNVREELGAIDIYLLDQVLRGLVPDRAVILDAGCGRGRNLQYFLKQGHEVFGVDANASAVEGMKQMAASLGGAGDDDHFRVEPIEALSFEDARFDFVICNAVLHFARDPDHFAAMVDALHRVIRPGATCFCRVASTIGIETLVQPTGPERWHRLPDGSDRFLVNLEYLLEHTERIGAELVDPIKTVNVQNLRCMTNWVWRRGK